MELENKATILQSQTILLLLMLQENVVPREFSPVFTGQLSDNEIKGHEIRCLAHEPQASTLMKLSRQLSFRTSDW